MPPQHLAEEFERALISLDRTTASRLFAEAQNGSPIQLVESLVVPALRHIGRAWEEGRVALSQVYMSGRICEELVSEVLPQGLPRSDRAEGTKMAIAVLEDYHVLGKRIVYAMLRASGYAVSDYGAGLSALQVSERAKADQMDILLISTLMLRSALKVKDLLSGGFCGQPRCSRLRWGMKLWSWA